MDDFERMLGDSLKEVSEGYRSDLERRRTRNRARFLARRPRPRLLPAAIAVAATALIVVVGLNVLPREDAAEDGLAPANRIGDRWVAEVIDIASPTDVGIKPGALWVSSATGTLTKLDADSGEVLMTIDLGGPGGDIEITDRDIWVAVPTTGTVMHIDARTGSVITTIPVGEPAEDMHLSAGPFRVWVVVPGRDIVQIDRATDEAVIIDLPGGEPIDIAARGEGVWLLDSQTGVSRLDPESGAIAERVADHPTDLTGDLYADKSSLWIANGNDDTVAQLDQITGAFGSGFEVPGNYIDMAVGTDAMWVLSSSGDGTVLTALDLVTGEPLRDGLHLAGDPVEVATRGTTVWVTVRDRDQIVKIALD